MKILRHTANMCPQDWFLHWWELCHRTNGAKETGSNDVRVLRVMGEICKAAPLLPSKRSSLDTRHSDNLKHEKSPSYQAYNLKWKGSELWQILLNSRQEWPFSLLFTWHTLQWACSKLMFVFIHWVTFIFSCLAVRSIVLDFAVQMRLLSYRPGKTTGPY